MTSGSRTDLETHACYDVQNECSLGLLNLLQIQELLQVEVTSLNWPDLH